jgi:hypothetical protein
MTQLISDELMQLMLRAVRAETVTVDQGTFLAVFEDAYTNALDVDDTSPALVAARASDVERLQVRKGASVTVSGKTYRVRVVEPDGNGMVVVRLGA